MVLGNEDEWLHHAGNRSVLNGNNIKVWPLVKKDTDELPVAIMTSYLKCFFHANINFIVDVGVENITFQCIFTVFNNLKMGLLRFEHLVLHYAPCTTQGEMNQCTLDIQQWKHWMLYLPKFIAQYAPWMPKACKDINILLSLWQFNFSF